MTRKPSPYHPKITRTYGLQELGVPPKGYTDFLVETVQAIQNLILEENKCKSLEDVAEKYARAMKKINPGITEKELSLGSPLAIGVDGELHYHRRISHARRAGRPYRSTEYEEKLPLSREQSRIHLQSARKDLGAFVRYLHSELDERFPERKGEVPNYIFDRNKRKKGVRNSNRYFYGFQFGLHFRSEPTSDLEVHVRLVNFGAISGRKLNDMYTIPGIKIEAELLVSGPMTLPERVAKALGKVVANHYKTDNIEYTTSFTKERRR